MVNIIFALSILSMDIPFSRNFEEEFTLAVELEFDNPTSWDEWKIDTARMIWWLENGWQVIEGVKEGTERLGVNEALIESRKDFNPLQINLAPQKDHHSAWSIYDDYTLILFSLSRCETLYQRHLVNQSAACVKNRRK